MTGLIASTETKERRRRKKDKYRVNVMDLTGGEPYLFPPEEYNVQFAFSDGRSSAFMLHQFLERNGSIPDNVKVMFQNTGREMNETLDFIEEVSQRWGVEIIWLELDVTADGEWSFQQVNHQTAARNGEPFRKMLEKRRMLPNMKNRFCTSDLKYKTASRYLNQILGWDYYFFYYWNSC